MLVSEIIATLLLTGVIKCAMADSNSNAVLHLLNTSHFTWTSFLQEGSCWYWIKGQNQTCKVVIQLCVWACPRPMFHTNECSKHCTTEETSKYKELREDDFIELEENNSQTLKDDVLHRNFLHYPTPLKIKGFPKARDIFLRGNLFTFERTDVVTVQQADYIYTQRYLGSLEISEKINHARLTLHNRQGHYDRDQIKFTTAYQLSCAENYYGCFCRTKCKETEKYKCDMDGKRICKRNHYPHRYLKNSCQQHNRTKGYTALQPCSKYCKGVRRQSFCDVCGNTYCQRNNGYVRDKTSNDRCVELNCDRVKDFPSGCQNGTCKNAGSFQYGTRAFFTCECDPGYEGALCSIRIRPTPAPTTTTTISPSTVRKSPVTRPPVIRRTTTSTTTTSSTSANSEPPSKPPSDASKQEKGDSGKAPGLSTLGILAIIIAVVCICCLVGYIGYRLRNQIKSSSNAGPASRLDFQSQSFQETVGEETAVDNPTYAEQDGIY